MESPENMHLKGKNQREYFNPGWLQIQLVALDSYRSLKPQLIDALCGDPDFLLQHCHSSRLVTQREYQHVKAAAVPSDKARDILDYMMSKDGKRVQRFLNLLKEKQIQEAFPKLEFLNHLPQNKLSATGCRTVTEKQLMMVARYIGTNWKEVGRVALELTSVRLEQIVEENPHNHRERVFSMLNLWSMREREKATAARLHTLLTQVDIGVAPGSIDFLLEES
ncbi:Death domain-containing protein CRADD [Bagarius yarrelli]|uniref:Death domain-containing protein CRADD n=1 Tax=Bagarius yarrelli TaxID=175774 RepID=A0A556U0B6_BAGYA|nr:Death domain-containing protein CRADD [Bagarius yarrelli]